jgi:hypothetical protein
MEGLKVWEEFRTKALGPPLDCCPLQGSSKLAFLKHEDGVLTYSP